MTQTTISWHIDEFEALSNRELYAALRLRQEVFSLEQASAYLDLDNADQAAIHIRGLRGAELIAYQRCLAPGVRYPESSLGRIVVSANARGKQLGRELVRRGIAHNVSRWPGHGISISAQAHLQEFYASFGFESDGALYDEDGIPHRHMVLAVR